jgi:hypothetical protein
MWTKCFTHARGCAGTVIGGRGAASRLASAVHGAPPPSPRPALPRQQALLATRCRHSPWPQWAGDVAGSRGRAAGAGATRGSPPARPCAPPAQPGACLCCAEARPPRPASLAGATRGRGGRAGGAEGGRQRQAGAVRSARPAPLAVGRATPIPSALSNAIETVQPGF